MKRRIRNGFTLIELLVVVAIIALLMSILLPSLGRAREQAKTLKCLSNMKTIGMAAMLYANQNDNSLPPANHSSTRAGTIAQVPPNGDSTTWACRLQYVLTGNGTPVNPPYGTSIKDCDPTWVPTPAFLCPNSNYNFIDRAQAHANYGWNGLMGVNIQTPQPPFSYKLTRISMPQSLILVADRWGKNAGGGRDANWGVAPPEPVAATGLGSLFPVAYPPDASYTYPEGAIRNNHGGPNFTANFTFADGHAENLKPEKTWQIPRARTQNSNFWMVF